MLKLINLRKQIHKILLKEFPKMEYSLKQISYLWSSYNQERWRMDPDPMVSAQKCLEKAENVDIIPIKEESGMFTLAFALKHVMSVLGPEVEEVALDGTCMWFSSYNHSTLSETHHTNQSTLTHQVVNSQPWWLR
jgi:hypothetical protein